MSDCVISKFVNKNVVIETATGSVYEGKIKSYDDFGLLFVPKDTTKLSTAFISWTDLKKVISADNDIEIE